MTWIVLYVVFVGGKVALTYGIWKLAKAQGRSPWPCLAVSVFCASIVFLALLIRGCAERSQQHLRGETSA